MVRAPDPSPGLRISSTAGFPRRRSRKRDSTITEIRKSGRHSLSRRSVGVSRMMSPMDRRRTIRMRAPAGRSGSSETAFKIGSLRFNLGVFDDHVGDIVFDGIDAPALGAFQPLSIRSELNGQLARRANQNIKQFLRYGHA